MTKITKSFQYVEFFAGIGGFRSALDKVGGECIFASEIEKNAKTSYAALYGPEHLHGDVTKIDAINVPDHDVLAGGFPCQAFSIAGKRKGFEDARGTLFFEIARVAKEKQPKAIFLENVKGLLSHDKGRTIEVIVRTLNEIGYIVDFHVLNTKYFGLPQNRERVFIMALRKDIVKSEKWKIKNNTILYKHKKRLQKEEKILGFNFSWPEEKKEVPLLADILEKEVPQKYYISEEKAKAFIEEYKKRNKETSTCLGKPKMIGLLDKDGYESLNRVYDIKGISPTLLATKRTKILTKKEVLPIISPNRIASRQNGRRIKTNGEPSFTLTTVNRHGIIEKNNINDYKVRVFTPLECWRLQGFTDAQFYKAKKALNETYHKGKDRSDSQLYKQAGNAVSVPVIQAIGEKLISYL